MQTVLSALLLTTICSGVCATLSFYAVNGFAESVTDADMVLRTCVSEPGVSSVVCVTTTLNNFGTKATVELPVTSSYVFNLTATFATAAEPNNPLTTLTYEGTITAYNFLLVAFTQDYDSSLSGIAANSASLAAYAGSEDPNTISNFVINLFYASDSIVTKATTKTINLYYASGASAGVVAAISGQTINFNDNLLFTNTLPTGSYMYASQYYTQWTLATGGAAGPVNVVVNALEGQSFFNLYIGNADVSPQGTVLLLSPPLQAVPPTSSPTKRPSRTPTKQPSHTSTAFPSIAASTSTNHREDKGFSALSTGAQAGVIIAILVVSAVSTLAGFYWYRLTQQRSPLISARYDYVDVL